jgi:hypothetical protein
LFVKLIGRAENADLKFFFVGNSGGAPSGCAGGVVEGLVYIIVSTPTMSGFWYVGFRSLCVGGAGGGGRVGFSLGGEIHALR